MTQKTNAPGSGDGPTAFEMAPGIYNLRIPLTGNDITNLDYVNTYLVKGERGWMLIDTGWNTPEALGALKTALHSLGSGIQDIEQVVLTHSHPDHGGLAGKIKKLSPETKVMMHQWESAVQDFHYSRFEEFQKISTELMLIHGARPDEISMEGNNRTQFQELVDAANSDSALFGGEIINTGVYDLEVIWTPGHSPGHICLYEPKNGILFSGDHILPGITPNIGYTNFSGDNPLGDFLYSLRKIEHLPVRMVMPGHEHPFSSFKERILEVQKHHREREAEIETSLQGGRRSAYELAAGLTWNLKGLVWAGFHPMHRRLATSEVISHLEHMRWNGRAKKLLLGGSIFYSTL